MNKVIEHDFTSPRCAFCGRPATKLCDAVLGESSYAGHPPRVNGVVDWNIPMKSTTTCDQPICDRCAVSITENMDLCPEHARKIKKE